MVDNVEKWGRKTARERYGAPTQKIPSPTPAHKPQKLGDSNNLQGPEYSNDASGWVRAPNEDATKKPGFDK